MSVEENREEFNKIIAQLQTNKPLPIRELKFIGCDLNADGITDITNAMKLNKTVETLSICENLIKMECMAEIGSMLRMNSKLKVLNLMNNNMNNYHIVALKEGLKLTSSLNTLCLSGNNIGDEGAEILLDCRSFNHNIASIIANSNPMAPFYHTFLNKKLKDLLKS
jgi:hypothetical protein